MPRAPGTTRLGWLTLLVPMPRAGRVRSRDEPRPSRRRSSNAPSQRRGRPSGPRTAGQSPGRSRRSTPRSPEGQRAVPVAPLFQQLVLHRELADLLDRGRQLVLKRVPLTLARAVIDPRQRLLSPALQPIDLYPSSRERSSTASPRSRRRATSRFRTRLHRCPGASGPTLALPGTAPVALRAPSAPSDVVPFPFLSSLTDRLSWLTVSPLFRVQEDRERPSAGRCGVDGESGRRNDDRSDTRGEVDVPAFRPAHRLALVPGPGRGGGEKGANRSGVSFMSASFGAFAP